MSRAIVWLVFSVAGVAALAGCASVQQVRARDEKTNSPLVGAAPRNVIPCSSVHVALEPETTPEPTVQVAATQFGPPAELLTPPRAQALPPVVRWQPPEPDGGPEEIPSSDSQMFDDGLKPISRITIYITPPPSEAAGQQIASLPEDLAARRFGAEAPLLYRSEPFSPWNAYGQLALSSDFCHRPLYFEDINLERYGRSHGIAQPLVSAARFYGTIPTLPYRLVAEPPGICQQDGNAWPAGAPAPRHGNLPPFNAKAGIVEAIAIVGLILLIP